MTTVVVAPSVWRTTRRQRPPRRHSHWRRVPGRRPAAGPTVAASPADHPHTADRPHTRPVSRRRTNHYTLLTRRDFPKSGRGGIECGTLPLALGPPSSLAACPYCSGAASTIQCQRIRLLAFLQVDWIPMLADCTSAVIPLSQVVREWAPSSSSPMKVSK